MTFSEYISNITTKDYVEYCEKNNITPQLDVKVVKSKLCLLVLPKSNHKDKSKPKQKNAP